MRLWKPSDVQFITSKNGRYREGVLKMPEENNGGSGKDIYYVLSETAERRRKEKKSHLLEQLEVKEYFETGGIKIDKATCDGVECKLCIDACPTHALYWRSGEVGIDEDLCIYCAACVLSCIVDNCIRVWRKRPNGGVEEFSTPKQVLTLLGNMSSKKRKERVEFWLEYLKQIPKIRKTYSV